MTDVLHKLEQVLIDRKQADVKSSYVASLYGAGLNKILEKIGEEATETILAAKDVGQTGNREAVVKETSDLLFHTLVMLAHLDISTDELLAELENRMGTSGLVEKASRNQSPTT